MGLVGWTQSRRFSRCWMVCEFAQVSGVMAVIDDSRLLPLLLECGWHLSIYTSKLSTFKIHLPPLPYTVSATNMSRKWDSSDHPVFSRFTPISIRCILSPLSVRWVLQPGVTTLIRGRRHEARIIVELRIVPKARIKYPVPGEECR